MVIGFAVGPRLLCGTKCRDQTECLLPSFLVAVGWWGGCEVWAITLITPESPVLFCSDKTMSGMGLLCSLGPTWCLWGPGSHCPAASCPAPRGA